MILHDKYGNEFWVNNTASPQTSEDLNPGILYIKGTEGTFDETDKN